MSTHKNKIRDKIIGLGEGSARKSYYPQLLQNIRELMETVQTLEKRETELENLVQEKSVLLEEVHHRVKNNFQIIESLLSLGRHTAVLPSEAAAFADTSRRIQVMSLVYERMLHSGLLSKVDICGIIRYIAMDAQHSMDKSRIRTFYAFDTDPLYCNVDTATPLALIADEVIAALYAYSFFKGSGELHIEISSVDTASEDRSHTIRIFDRGPGIPESTINVLEKQLGITLIRNLCSQTGGTYAYTPAGTGNYNISFSIVLKKEHTT